MNERKLPNPEIRKIDLGDRKSITMNFRFSKEALDALDWLSKKYGVSKKDTLHFATDVLPVMEEAINALISVDEQIEFNKVEDKRTRRTVVISKKTLDYVNQLSNKSKLTRDDIINKSIVLAKKFALSVDELPTEAYREAFDLIDNFYQEAQGVEFKLRELLGDDNLIVDDFGLGVTMIMNAYVKIEEEIKQRGDDPK
ncbi:MAG: hypothetical protein ACLP7A_10830 [Desulfobaccales bacterium]